MPPTPPPLPTFGFAPYRLSGTVVGALLNHQPLVAQYAAVGVQAPYNKLPVRPVLYIKPRNTFCESGATVLLLEGETGLEVGATLGVVLGQTLCKASEALAAQAVAGYGVVADLCIPHTSLYRPSVRLRAVDGFCPLGPVVPASEVQSAHMLRFTVSANGQPVHQGDTGDRVRPMATLLADISQIMTLNPGDMVLMGTSVGAPVVSAGVRVTVAMEGLPELSFNVAQPVHGDDLAHLSKKGVLP